MLLIVIGSICVLYVYVIHIMKIFCVLWRETNEAAKLEVESCRCHSLCVRKRNEIEKSKNLFYVVKSRPYIFLLLLLFRRSYWQYFFLLSFLCFSISHSFYLIFFFVLLVRLKRNFCVHEIKNLRIFLYIGRTYTSTAMQSIP